MNADRGMDSRWPHFETASFSTTGLEPMRIHVVTTTAALLLALGCAGSYPPPTQQMADVESANRSATELGAQRNPQAQLHLKLAEEQLKQAQVALAHDDNQNATRLLTRAKADAELAVALTRGATADTEANNALDQSNAQRSVNVNQGAAQ
jgi:hypothetical protein